LLPDKKNAQHFTGNKKCAGAKYRRGRKPERCFAEAEPPLVGGVAVTVC
jgi:hypothetical protein